MRDSSILYPMFALVAWTFVVLSLIPLVRVRSAMRREVVPADFRYGESPAVPAYVSVPNRNYMNLLELPLLFYVGCLLLYVTDGGSRLAVFVAWTFVGLRVGHSVVHLTYNHVIHRLAVFALSNAALVCLWIVAAVHLGSAGAT